MADRFEGAHPRGPVGERRHRGERRVDHGDHGRDLGDARQHLLGQIGGLGAEQLHAADAQHRQHGDRHDDDADAAQPLQKRAPQQDARRRAVEADDHRRARRGQARHRLEERVGVAEVEHRQGERQRGEGGRDDPRERRQQEHLAHRERDAARAVHQHEHDADEEREERGDEEDAPVGVAGCRVDERRHEHEGGEDRQEDADDEEDGPEVDHRGRATRLPWRNDGG